MPSAKKGSLFKNLKSVLFILSILVSLSGLGYLYILQFDNQLLHIVYLAFLYMPTPLYALLCASIFDKDIKPFKYIKKHHFTLKGFGYALLIFYAWAVVTLLLSLLLSWLLPEYFGEFAISNDQLLHNIVALSGQQIPASELPPSPLLLIPIGLVSALTAGFTVNLLFALGEEVLWRGFLWEKLKHLSNTKITLITGFFWGMWHIPLIAQGYNYGDEFAVEGSLLFILFCITFSYLFVLLMRKTGSTILAAGLHGMFNAFAGIFTLLIVNGSSLIDGAIGLVSIFSMVIVGFLFYAYRRIRKNS